MINIFNLFLFLFFTISVILMVLAQEIAVFYAIIGFFTAVLLSFIAYKTKFIEKNSEMIYLNFSFYSHFLTIFIISFLKSMKMMFLMIFTKKEVNPIVFKVEIKDLSNVNKNVFKTTVNMFVGLSVIENQGNIVAIYALNEEYFYELNINKIIKNLSQINENEII